MVKALVPGTFDPVTVGHLDVIERAATLFDSVVVGVAKSADKRSGPLFSLEERVSFVQDAVNGNERVEVLPFETLLVDFARKIGAKVVVKGLRAATDFEWEFQQSALNYHFNPDMESVFIMSTPHNTYLSSSVVREVAAFKGDITGLVPSKAGLALVERFGCTYRP